MTRGNVGLHIITLPCLCLCLPIFKYCSIMKICIKIKVRLMRGYFCRDKPYCRDKRFCRDNKLPRRTGPLCLVVVKAKCW